MEKVDVADVTLKDGREAFVVSPTTGAAGPAAMFLHWFDEAPNANRTQYIDEASALASFGVVSLLPQLRFPWESPPTDRASDLRRIDEELAALKDGIELLHQVDGVDPARVAVVGHDFGAMHGTLLLREMTAKCAIFIAPTARWADWFLSFWPITGDRFDYLRALDRVDPINAIGAANCPLLLQFARNDFYIAPMTGMAMLHAAPEPKRMELYEGGHDLDVEQARTDRFAFLKEHLGV